MTEIAEYERRGDLDAPFELTKRAERAQAEADHMSDALRCDVPRLTWEQYLGGQPCPGCGRPYRDDEHWESKGTKYLTDDERARYEAEKSRFKQDHQGCGSHRHSVSGSLTTHCGKCCPPPPLSPGQIDSLRAILSTPKSPQELMQWRLRLYCGHVIVRTAHRTHKTLQAACTGSTVCSECGLNPATIVDAEAVGLKTKGPCASGPAPSIARDQRSGKPTRAEPEAKVRELEEEVLRLRRNERGCGLPR